MLPTILDGGTPTERATHIHQLTSSSVELIQVSSETSIKIKDIQALQSQLTTTPRLPRIVWFEADKITLPAQNALLKLLEEPPSQTRFFLTCDSASSLLTTIQSRCLKEHLNSAPLADPELLVKLKSTLAESPGHRLNSLPKYDRATALSYFHQLEILLRDHLSTTKSAPQARFLALVATCVQQALVELSHNVSVSLVMESFLLHLPKTK